MPMSESEMVIRTLYEITTETSKGFAYQVKRLLTLGCDRFNLDIGILARIDAEKYEIIHKVCPPDVPLNVGDIFELGNTYCSMTLGANGPIYYEYVKYSDMRTHPAYKSFGLESYIGVPVKVDGHLYGTLNFSSPNPHNRKFKEIDIDALQLMASWLNAGLLHEQNQRKLEETNKQLKELANRDGLTNLFNRRFFQESMLHHLHLANRTNYPVSLMILDIDNFKSYNDTYGHLEGDSILSMLSELLLSNRRNSDVVARFGGEEFAILMPDTDKTGSLHITKLIKSSMQKHEWPRRKITASFGVSTIECNKVDSDMISDLCMRTIKEADDALYHAKNNGRNELYHFTDL